MEIEKDSKSQSKQKKDIFSKKKEMKRAESRTKKSQKTKEYKTVAGDDFQKPKTMSELTQERRSDRINRNLQLRKNKLNEILFKRRGLIDSDGNSSLDVAKNKSMSLSNLTQLIDMTVYKIPPKICALISLNEDANLDILLEGIDKVIKDNLATNEKEKFEYKLNNFVHTYLIPRNLYVGKERITFIKTSRNFYSILDACKVADIIVFVSSCKKCQPEKCAKDPDTYSFCIDKFGYEVISLIRAQGFTDQICLIQDISTVTPKRKNEVVNLYKRYFDSELKPNKVFEFFNNSDKEAQNDSSMDLNDENKIKAILSYCCAIAPYTRNLDLQKHRSYLMIEDIRKREGSQKNEAEIFGYIRGNTLNPGKYLHITGFGDYKIQDVEVADDPIPVKSKYDKEKEKNIRKNSSNNNKNKGGMMELEEGNNNNKENDKTDKKTNNNDNKSYQVNNDIVESNKNIEMNLPTMKENLPELVEDQIGTNDKNKKMEEEVNDDEDIIDFNIDLKDDDDEISYQENESQEKEDEEEKNKISKKHKTKTSLEYRSKEEMEFQDEVDTPIDIPAKERFKKYRGLESMKTGSWNPLMNLPKEYRTIFSFENIKNTYRISVKKAHDDGLKLSGNYVKIIVENFDFENLKYIKEDIPIVGSTLLDHERKLCVMHYKFNANYEQEDYIIQNMNKKVFECHCGFRRYLIKPIFSKDIFTGGDKLKFQKFLEKDVFYVMTCYAQLTYANSPVIIFTHKNNDMGVDKDLAFVGTGVSMEANDKKIILKKIVLTGYPVKIKKKKAIVRYMFFQPSDINYFKPIQLTTKKGLRGNIRESVGTHGYMKCIFSDFIKSNDTVCLNLFKRVFPKYFKETWKYKVFNGNREDYLSYFKEVPQNENKDEENKEGDKK